MKRSVLAIALLLIATSGAAQVTIATEDLEYGVGGFYHMYNVGSPHGVIGLTGIQGGPHVFDFSEGITATQWAFDYVDPADGGHGGDFPLATVAERKTSGGETSWLYLDFQTGVGRTSYGFYDAVGLPESPSVPFSPPIVDFPDNLSYQSFFEGATTFVATSSGIDLDVDYEFVGFCDAWGTVILPDGAGEHDCIQVNYEEQYTYKWMGTPIQYSWVRSYYYLAEDLGIVAIIISREDEAPVPSNFTIANAIARMYDSSKLDPLVDVAAAPAAFRLARNYPNPFNPHTTIGFDLDEAADLRLNVFDASGRLVDTLLDGPLPAGGHDVVWMGTDGQGKDVASGVYHYRLEVGARSVVRKMTLLR